jgi:hypothetical protein
MRQVRIVSYFSLPTDLAAEMQSWPEFVSGSGYRVSLSSENERVNVALITESEEEGKYVVVRGEGDGPLFQRALGCVAYALAGHSDDISIMRWSYPEPGVTPGEA